MAGNTDALHAAVDAWNAHDRDRYVDAYAPDAALHGFPPDVTDAASLGDFFAGMWSAVPDAQIAIDDVLEEGDRLAVRLTVRGTHEGELMGVPASHRPIEFGVMTIVRIDDDKRIAERWNTADFLTLLQQIGGVPAPA
jgi:steroid delta-isomerase-like uncharacterized protein